MEGHNSRIESIKTKVTDSKYVPTSISTIRAGVSSIPFIGSALDHLIFDKADVIRSRNIEQSIDDITKKIQNISEERLTKEWFESTEAIEMFRQLIEKVQFEADDKKIKTIAEIYAISGTTEFSSDPNKFAVLRKASELSSAQKEVLLIISTVQISQREFSNAPIRSSGTAIWFDDIFKAVAINPKGQFWPGKLVLDVEVGILESLNLLRKVNVMMANVDGYEITALGNLLIKYFKA